jgi:inosine/guanosine/xanthosine phosphorylase family protein
MEDAKKAAEYLRSKLGKESPKAAVVLGSGLGSIAESLEDARSTSMQEVPGFPAATVAGHAGEVHLGGWAGNAVLIFQGRVHLYEGQPVDRVTLGVRAAAELGAERIILTNAAGSCDRAIPPGSLMRAQDLIDLFFRRLRGDEAAESIGGGGALDPELGRRIDEAAIAEGIRLAHGVLCGSSGPSYETAAEIRFLRSIGAHAACMSTIPETWAARNRGMAVAVVSLITNYGTGISKARLAHDEVVEWAAKAGKDLGRLLRETVRRLP